MPPVYFARNYRALRDARWQIPEGLSAVVGPNGAGKTTLLYLPHLLKTAITATGGLPAAIEESGGTRTLRYVGSPNTEPIVLGAEVDDVKWSIEPTPNGVGIGGNPAEQLDVHDAPVLIRTAGSPNYDYGGKDHRAGRGTVLRRLYDADTEDTFVGKSLVEALQRYSVHMDYDLPALRRGSEASAARTLDAQASTAFSVLRNWHGLDEDAHRWEFVIESLRECFGFFEDINFLPGGNIVEGLIVHRGVGRPTISAAHAANGLLAALAHFTAIASAEPGGVVAIDEFENSLHPRAITQALTCIDAYVTQYRISVVLSTQSPQVLDWFDGRPEAVFVLRGGVYPGPEVLASIRNATWLSHFRLGDKFAEGDFGAELMDTEGRG